VAHMRPTFITGTKEYRIKVDKVDQFPPGDECYVSVIIMGNQFEAFVPSSTVDDKVPFIMGKMVGKTEKNVLISLAPSSMGTTIWEIPQDAMDNIVVLNNG